MFVKICGITRGEDARLAVELGASAVGFVFWPASPRFIHPDAARAIVSSLPPFVAAIGVFVDEAPDLVQTTARHVGLSAVQLHGAETPEYVARLGLRVIKSVRADEASLARLDEWADTVTLLVDAPDDERKGGTGIRPDWSVAARMAARRPLALAGGLAADNVGQAIRVVRPIGVDVSSGVEQSPGVKDHAAMRRFFEAVRLETSGALPVFGRRDPDARGYFGAFGGRFVPETLVAPVEQLEQAYLDARADPAFAVALSTLLANYAGRPTPLSEAARFSSAAGGARVFLKREDLTHTGAHKINNALGQALLAARMGKSRVIAETGAGQHGVATATACALLGLRCEVYMGAEDMRRQAPNVARMEWLGARVRRVDGGSRTLKDAINEAMRDWVANVRDTYYLLGSALGPHPYPLMVREFQSIIGAEARRQILATAGRLPDAVVACVGGGSNAIGIFDAFLDDAVGPAGRRRGWRHRARGGPSRGPFRRGLGRRAAGHPDVHPPGLRWQHRGDALDLGRDGLRGGRPRACLAARARPHRVRPRERRRGGRRRSGISPAWRASSPRWSRRMPWPLRAGWRPKSGRPAS